MEAEPEEDDGDLAEGAVDFRAEEDQAEEEGLGIRIISFYMKYYPLKLGTIYFFKQTYEKRTTKGYVDRMNK